VTPAMVYNASLSLLTRRRGVTTAVPSLQ
jgi:hypothetical protein